MGREGVRLQIVSLSFFKGLFFSWENWTIAKVWPVLTLSLWRWFVIKRKYVMECLMESSPSILFSWCYDSETFWLHGEQTERPLSFSSGPYKLIFRFSNGRLSSSALFSIVIEISPSFTFCYIDIFLYVVKKTHVIGEFQRYATGTPFDLEKGY